MAPLGADQIGLLGERAMMAGWRKFRVFRRVAGRLGRSPAHIAGSRHGLVIAPCVIALLLAAELTGCSHDRNRPPRPEYTGILYSPNGEPLSGGALGHPACEKALSVWFDRVDGNHDARIDAREFMMDTHRQFAAMDLDHSGVITASELARYRAPYETTVRRQSVAANEGGSGEGSNEGRDNRGRHSRHGGQSGWGRRAAAGGPVDMSDNEADPVMSADTALRFEVRLEDFLAYAQQKFSKLDRDGDGTLDRDEVVASCPRR